MEYNEETNESMEEDTQQSKFKQWFQNNLRIIISVVIVVLIAGGIYSYSKRSETPLASDTEQKTEQQGVLGSITGNEDNNAATENPAVTEENKNTEPSAPVKVEEKKETTSSIATSQETENSFVETAARGEGSTKLARRALANYLEKNPDSSLTPEHKIYIEDYMRKKAANKGSVRIGTSVEFSKSLIQEAISKSKNLNQNQLKNLHKYAVRVPSLS